MVPPRVRLLNLPTPLSRLERFGDALDIELWIKRDDATDPLLSGNKARKIEYVLGEAKETNADILVAAGLRAQTNLSRVTAIAARRAGLDSLLVLGTGGNPADEPVTENLFLSKLAGAEVRFVEKQKMLEQSQTILEEVAAELRSRGRRPLIIPYSATGARSTWAGVDTVQEIIDALPTGEPPLFVFPVATGGTAAGILLGLALFQQPLSTMGVLVTNWSQAPAIRASIAKLAQQAAALGGRTVEITEESVHLIDGTGAGLGVSSPEEIELLAELARTEGIVLEPIYTIKAMLALASLAKKNALPRRRVVFIQTGGVFGLFHQEAMVKRVLGW